LPFFNPSSFDTIVCGQRNIVIDFHLQGDHRTSSSPSEGYFKSFFRSPAPFSVYPKPLP